MKIIQPGACLNCFIATTAFVS